MLAEVQREITDPGNSDAIAFAAGARLVLSNPQHLYDPAAQSAVEASLLHIPAPSNFLNPFTNLAAGALLLSPLAGLDLHAGSEVFALVSLLLFGLSLMLILRLLDGVVSRTTALLLGAATVLSLPAIDAVIQWDSLLAAALLGAALLLRRRQLFVAGLVLATLVLKPQVVWLVIPALVAARSWRMLAGFAVGAAAWIGVSAAVAGPGTFVALAQLIAREHVGEAGRSVGLPSLVAALTGSGTAGFAAAALFGATAVALVVWNRDVLRNRPTSAIALGVPLSILCSPHVSQQDTMLLALPAVVLAAQWPRLAVAELLAVSGASALQLALPAADRHLEPVVVTVVAISTWMAVRDGRMDDASIVRRGGHSDRHVARSAASSVEAPQLTEGAHDHRRLGPGRRSRATRRMSNRDVDDAAALTRPQH